MFQVLAAIQHGEAANRRLACAVVIPLAVAATFNSVHVVHAWSVQAEWLQAACINCTCEHVYVVKTVLGTVKSILVLGDQ